VATGQHENDTEGLSHNNIGTRRGALLPSGHCTTYILQAYAAACLRACRRNGQRLVTPGCTLPAVTVHIDTSIDISRTGVGEGGWLEGWLGC